VRLYDLRGAGELHDEPAFEIQNHLDDVRFFTRFEHVAGAIALHNIYPRLYSTTTCANYGLDRFFYPVDDKDRFAMAPSNVAFAYLMALTDALQDWDRHSFRPPRFAHAKKKSEPITAAEVLLHVGEDGINIQPLSEAAESSYAKKMTDMKATLVHPANFLRCG